MHFHGGDSTQKMNSMYRKVAEKICKLSNAQVYTIDYHTGEELVYPSVHNECYNAYINLISTVLKDKKFILISKYKIKRLNKLILIIFYKLLFFQNIF